MTFDLVSRINATLDPANLFSNLTNFLNLLISEDLQKDLYLLKLIYLGFSLILIPPIIYFLARSSFLQWYFLTDLMELLTFKPFGLRKREREWRRITGYLAEGTEDAYKLAIIEADNLMNQILKRLGIPGTNIEERLKNATPSQIPNLEKLREAHQFRNNIVHDPALKVELDKTREILGEYEKTLKDLELL